jgi:hypothetical protein
MESEDTKVHSWAGVSFDSTKRGVYSSPRTYTNFYKGRKK